MTSYPGSRTTKAYPYPLQFELYDSPKFNHFDRIRDESGIDYEDMVSHSTTFVSQH